MTSRIKAAIRIRPFLKSQIKGGYINNCVRVSNSGKEVQVYDGQARKSFSFDHIFDQGSSQGQIYQDCEIDHLIEKSLKGYHATVFAYGQTGSGKTYTMHGDEQDGISVNSGLIPKIFSRLFEQIRACKERTYAVSLSFLQIYNEKILDLLNPSPTIGGKGGLQNGLRLRWNKDEQFSVENLFIFECLNQEDLFNHFSAGLKNRINASHKLNVQSSRSHSILTIRIDSFDHLNHGTLSSKIELVDLAGSQRIGLTGTEGRQAKESIDINKSLFTLRQVISILSDSSRSKGRDKDKAYVPYRDSKLTSILKQSIGGNSYCLMIACINPNDMFLQQNLSTLTYATKASFITNQPTINDDPKAKVVNDLKRQVKALTQQLNKANQHIDLITSLQQQPPRSQIRSQQVIPAPMSGMKRGQSQRMGVNLGGQQFSQRLVESINMVRQLLKSNKQLREQLEISNQRNDHKDVEIYQITKDNEFLKQKLQGIGIQGQKVQEEIYPQINPFTSGNLHNSPINRRRHSTNNQRPSTNNQKQRLNNSQLQHHPTQQPGQLLSGGGMVSNGNIFGFNSTNSKNNFNYWNSVQINQYYMNERGIDSMPTNFSRKEVNTAQDRRPSNSRNSSMNQKISGRNAITAKSSHRNWKNVDKGDKFLVYQESEPY